MSPADATFSLLSCPHPPTRARRALFPAGRGRFLLFYCKGLRPLHPRGWTGRSTGSAGVGGARRGGLPGWSSVLPAVPMPSGGLAFLVACLPCLLLAFLPPSPYPRSQSALPGGKGEFFVILLQGASPLASPGQAGRGTGSALRKRFCLVSPEDAGYSYSQ